MMQRSIAGKCSILLILNTLASGRFHWGLPAVFNNYEQK